MPAPNEPRQVSPPLKKKHPQKAPKRNYFSTLMDTPEGRAKRKAWSTKRRKKGGRPVGTPDGHRLNVIEPIRKEIKLEAKQVVALMIKKLDIKDTYQTEALEAAVEIMRCPGAGRDRLAAARLILDFTMSKPVAQAQLSITRAEDFLASLIEGEVVDDAAETIEYSETTSH